MSLSGCPHQLLVAAAITKAAPPPMDIIGLLVPVVRIEHHVRAQQLQGLITIGPLPLSGYPPLEPAISLKRGWFLSSRHHHTVPALCSNP